MFSRVKGYVKVDQLYHLNSYEDEFGHGAQAAGLGNLSDTFCCGAGIMHVAETGPPTECVEFVADLMEAPREEGGFGIATPFEVTAAIEAAAGNALMYVDFEEPYALFQGWSDMVATDDGSQYAFTILDPSGERYEARPELIETFRMNPGKAEECYQYFRANRCLESLHDNHGMGLRDHLWDHVPPTMENLLDHDPMDVDSHSSVMANLTREMVTEVLHRSCTYERDGRKIQSGDRFIMFMEIAAWAAFVWIQSPLSRQYRKAVHLVYAEGLSRHDWETNPHTVVLYNGEVLLDTNYIVEQRPPRSCHSCGTANSWCTEYVTGGEKSGFLCEHCLTRGQLQFEGANCGSKICPAVSCVHHPNHGDGFFGYIKKQGQLTSMATSGQATLTSQGNLLLE